MSDQRSGKWRALLSKTTTLSQVLAGVLVSGYLAQFSSSFRAYFTLVAGRTIPCVWNFLTAGLIEAHFVTMVLNAVAVLVLSKHIEPVYGSKPYLRFILMILGCSGLCAFLSVYLAYALDRNESSDLLFLEICGFHGVTAGMLVAIKQIMPDTEIPIFRKARLRAKHLPSLYVLASSVISLAFGRVIATMPFVFGGTYSAWFFLRYLQPSAIDPSHRGDNSPDFSYASFYPRPVQPIVDKFAGFVAKVFRLGRSASPTTFALGAAKAPAAISMEASRRRERGQRALEERMGKTPTTSPQPEATIEPRGTLEEQPKDVETGHGASGTRDTGSSEIQAVVVQPPHTERN